MDGTAEGSNFDDAVDPITMLVDAMARMPYGVSVWSRDYRLLYWNDAYLSLYGTPADLLRRGMTMRERLALSFLDREITAERLDLIVARHHRRLATSTDPAVPAVYRDRIGALMVERTYLVCPGLGWVVIHEDETARLKREQETRVYHRRIDLALESMDYGFSLFDGDLALLLWNERMVELYGLSPREVVTGMSLHELLLASIAAGNHQGWTAAEIVARERSRLAGIGPGESTQSEAVLASGRVVRIRWKCTAGGWWVVTHEDVTEERDQLLALQRREAELALQNGRFLAAVDHMTQGLCMFDARQELIICNERYARIYNLSSELTRPGTRLVDIWRHIGFEPPEGEDACIRARLASLAVGDVPETLELSDGRLISVIHRPLPEGGWVATHEDVTEQRRSEARTSHLARHDELTGLPNRLLFRERMQDAEDQVAAGEVVAVLYIDLDHFKAVNDLYGHIIGDAALQQVAQRLIAACRDTDVVARLGGDEFAILQLGLGAAQDASVLAERVVRALSNPLKIHGHEMVLGASVGIAVAPDDGKDAETLIRNADLAAYRAKAEGRGAYHFFEHGMDAALQERLSFEMQLRGALARNEFTLAFQPLVSISEDRIASVEALLRWNHPQRGLVAPDRVIPAAERSGLIGPIGEWVLREACMTAASWPDDVSVSVNVSALQFGRKTLIRHVEDALRVSGLHPSRLDIEVTESALLANNELTVSILKELRRIGVRISLDDFGTGYSTIGYLREFCFDKIKIDRSFVRDLDDGPGHGTAIMKAVIGLGRSLGIATTAEGVETSAQLDFVRGEGCNEVQGYIFSPPLPASAIARKLASQGAGHGLWQSMAS